ncbi:MAG: N-acetylmuramoyl-L-alanine amidase [Kiritimatiellia bacterium]
MNIFAVEIGIVFPPKGSTLSAGDRTFVAGCIKPATAELTVNGKSITPYHTGSFVYMQKISEGKNILELESGKYKKEHHFFLRKPAADKISPTITPVFPVESSGIMTGRAFTVSCKAPKGSNPSVQIGERVIELRPDSSGTKWESPLKFHCPLKNLPVMFSAENLPDAGGGMLNALAETSLFKVTGDLFSTRARSGQDSGGTIAFLMPGDVIISDGYTGNYRKMQIQGRTCYVNNKYLKPVTLPDSIKPNPQITDIAQGFGPHPPENKKPGEMLIALDAGHGGKDSGAIGPSGLREKTVTLQQAKVIAEVLQSHGYKTFLTRKSDVYAGLYDRVRTAYRKKADAFISIHYNSCPSYLNPKEKRYTASYCWNDIGKELAGPVSSELAKISPARNAGVKYGNFAVCRNPAIPSILIELDFITVPESEELIQTTQFQKKAAEAIAAGLRAWHKR